MGGNLLAGLRNIALSATLVLVPGFTSGVDLNTGERNVIYGTIASDFGTEASKSATPVAGTSTTGIEATGAQLYEAATEPAKDESTESDSSDTASTEEAPADARLQAGDTLLIQYQAPEDGEISESTVEQILGKRIFKLDTQGQLRLPIIGTMPMAGLNEKQAAQRLKAEPLLRELFLSVAILPLQPFGSAALTPFGYDLFDTGAGFEPASGLPVPDTYIVGPGDTVQIQLFGKSTDEYSLQVSPDGVLSLPQVGALQVAGSSFAEMKQLVQDQIAKRMIGVTAHVSMSTLRSITVYVVGEVKNPGSYTVSALSTITNALVSSGGVKNEGSLRNIQLKRHGNLVTRFDLYDLLMRGDKRADRRLQTNDVIFVPPIGATVGVSGEVIRPAIYELRGEKTVKQLLDLAGGLKPGANLSAGQLQRVEQGRKRTLTDLNLGSSAQLAMRLQPGDLLVVPGVEEALDNAITLRGHVKRPGQMAYRSGLHLHDLLSTDDLLPNADLDYALIKRRPTGNGSFTLHSVRLRDALTARSGTGGAMPLKAHDEILIFRGDDTSDRQALLAPVLADLRKQARAGAPAAIASIGGMVRAPGEYPIDSGMRVSDLVRAAGSLAESALTMNAELTRYRITERHAREASHSTIDLSRALAGDPEHDLTLAADDHLVIRQVTAFYSQYKVEIRGEVRYPGIYPVARGEQLSSLLDRAGGLTDYAFTDGSILLRDELAEREQEQIDRLTERLETALATYALNKLTNPDQEETVGAANQLIGELRATEAKGRLVIDLPRIVEQSAGGLRPSYDVTLKDGDALYIPAVTQEVTVMGEVFHPTSHMWEAGMSRDDFINLSGGLTEKSDDDRIYVIRANGAVLSAAKFNGSRWDWSGGEAAIKPGDTIVVPLDVDRLRPLQLWTSVSQIVFQLGTTVAQLERAFRD